MQYRFTSYPPYADVQPGQTVPGGNLMVEQAKPGRIAWGSTPATADQHLFSSGMSMFKENIGGIYRNTVGDTSGGTQLVRFYDYSAGYVHDIEWLHDESGFLFSIPAADIATVGPANVTVFNPAPGGGTSNTAAFGTVEQHYTYMPGIRR